MTESCASDGCSRLSITTGSGIDFDPMARLPSATATSAAPASNWVAVRGT
jgi:hypothetical protein